MDKPELLELAKLWVHRLIDKCSACSDGRYEDLMELDRAEAVLALARDILEAMLDVVDLDAADELKGIADA